MSDDDKQLNILSCPCGQGCESNILTSPKGLVELLLWECKTNPQDIIDEFKSLKRILCEADLEGD